MEFVAPCTYVIITYVLRCSLRLVFPMQCSMTGILNLSGTANSNTSLPNGDFILMSAFSSFFLTFFGYLLHLILQNIHMLLKLSHFFLGFDLPFITIHPFRSALCPDTRTLGDGPLTQIARLPYLPSILAPLVPSKFTF